MAGEEDDGVDPKLQGPIAPGRRTRTMRQRWWRAQLAPGNLLSTAMPRRLQLGHGHGAVRVRVSCSGGKRGGERAGRGRGASYPPGGPRREGAAEEDTAMHGHGASGFTVAPGRRREGRETDRGGPPVRFLIFSLFHLNQ